MPLPNKNVDKIVPVIDSDGNLAEQDDKLDLEELHIESETTSIMYQWDIDKEIAREIAINQFSVVLDMNMYITNSGIVESAKNEYELKEKIMKYFDTGGLEEIAYIFVDGEPKNVDVEIEFSDLEEDNEKVEEETEEQSMFH